MIILDTDILIDLLRAKPRALAWFEATFAGGDALALSVVTKLELFKGCRDQSERRVVLGWVRKFQLLHVTEAIGVKADAVFQQYHPRHGMGILDALIASTALCWDGLLYSGNAKHFRGIRGLQLRVYRC